MAPNDNAKRTVYVLFCPPGVSHKDTRVIPSIIPSSGYNKENDADHSFKKKPSEW